jgi:hypothetical protein
MSLHGSLLDHLLAGREVSITAKVTSDGSDFEGVANVKILPHYTRHASRLDVSLVRVKGEPPLEKVVSLAGEIEIQSGTTNHDRIELPRCYFQRRSHSDYGALVPSIRLTSWPPTEEKKPRLRRWLLSSSPWAFLEGNVFQNFLNGSVVLDPPPDQKAWSLEQLHKSLVPREESVVIAERKHMLRNHYSWFHPRRHPDEERPGTIVEVHRTLSLEETPESTADPFESVAHRGPERLRRVLSYIFETHVGVDIAVDYFGDYHLNNTVHVSGYPPRARAASRFESFPLYMVGYDLPLELLKGLETSPDGPLCEKAMELAAESRDQERPAPARFYSAFVALESLAGELADKHDLVKTPKKKDYDTIRHLIEDALDKIEDADVRSTMKDKIPELKRASLSAMLFAVFQRYSVKIDDLWSGTTPQEGLKAIARMRNDMFHAGKEPEKGTDLLHAEQRLRIIFDRLLLRVLGATAAAEGYEKGIAFKIPHIQRDSFFAEIT